MSKEFAETFGWLGSIIAVVISYAKWHSFWWALLHGLLGWIYVIYFYCKGY